MSRLLVIAALVGIVASPGCYGGGGDEPEAPIENSPLTATELGWFRGYSAWAIAVDEEGLGPPDGPKLVAACRRRLTSVGVAPSPRLEPAAERAATVCPLLARPGTLRRALDTLDAADELILPLLRDEQTLPLGTGTTETSRADVRLSEVASDVIGEPVEVRCWDVGDWKRVITEGNAWSDDDQSYADLVGQSKDGDDRIHVLLEFCNTMARAAAGDVGAWSRVDRIDAADAFETLAHEIQHFRLADGTEAQVECAAIRSLPSLLRRLGLSARTAGELTQLYRTEVYPELDEEYRRGTCSQS
jgi:hypothetical protein